MARFLHWFFLLFPLAFSLETSQHFELPKVACFFIGCIGILSLIRAYEIFADGNLTFTPFKKVKWLTFALLLYLFYLTIQTFFFALSPSASFWGNYERHQGLFLIFGLAYFSSLLISRKWIRKELYLILHGIMGGAFLISLTGLWQFFSDFPFGNIATTLGRVYGTAGHPNFLGQFLLPSLLLHVFFIFKERENIVWKRVVLRISFFVQIFTLLATENRSSIIAFLLGLVGVGFFVYKAMFDPELKKKLKPYIYRLVLLLGAVGVFYVTFKLFDGAFTRSLVTRAYMFPYVLQMIAKSPFFGYGLDSFNFAFSPFFPSGMGETENFLNMPDRAHNEILDLLSEQGILGLFCAGLCVAALFYYVRKSFFGKKYTSEEALLLYCLCTSLIILEVSYLAGFATTMTKVLEAGIFAVIINMLVFDEVKICKNVLGRTLFAVLCAFMGTVFGVIGYRIYAGDVSYAKTETRNLIEAIDMSPYRYEYLVFGSDRLSESEDKLHFLEKAEKMNTYDYFLYLQKGRAFSALQDSENALKSFGKAEELCPHCPLIFLYGGEALERMGKHDEAKKYFEKYMNLTPSFYKKVYLEHLPKEQLSAYEQERLRIFVKENEVYLNFVSNALDMK